VEVVKRPHGPSLSRLLFDRHPVTVLKFFVDKLIDFPNLIFGNLIGVGNRESIVQSLLSKWAHSDFSQADSSVCAVVVNYKLIKAAGG